MLLDSVKNLVIDCRCCVKTFDPLTFVTSNRSHSLPQKGAFFLKLYHPLHKRWLLLGGNKRSVPYHISNFLKTKENRTSSISLRNWREIYPLRRKRKQFCITILLFYRTKSNQSRRLSSIGFGNRT